MHILTQFTAHSRSSRLQSWAPCCYARGKAMSTTPSLKIRSKTGSARLLSSCLAPKPRESLWLSSNQHGVRYSTSIIRRDEIKAHKTTPADRHADGQTHGHRKKPDRFPGVKTDYVDPTNTRAKQSRGEVSWTSQPQAITTGKSVDNICNIW